MKCTTALALLLAAAGKVSATIPPEYQVEPRPAPPPENPGRNMPGYGGAGIPPWLQGGGGGGGGDVPPQPPRGNGNGQNYRRAVPVSAERLSRREALRYGVPYEERTPGWEDRVENYRPPMAARFVH